MIVPHHPTTSLYVIESLNKSMSFYSYRATPIDENLSYFSV